MASNNEAISDDLETEFSTPFSSTAAESAEGITNALDQAIDAYLSTDQDFGPGATVLAFDQTRVLDGDSYSLSSGVVTLKKAGRYRVSYGVSGKIRDSGTDRCTSGHVLEEDSGGSFAAIPGSYRFAYHRTAGVSQASASGRIVLETSTTNVKIRLVSYRAEGSGNLEVTGWGTGLLIERL